MKRFAVIANCQRRPIVQTLKKSSDFVENFQEVMFPPVFQMEDKHFKHLDNWLPKLDLIIYQPVNSDSFKTARAGYIESTVPASKRIKIPNLYFAGYQPDLIKYGAGLSKVEQYRDLFARCGIQQYRCIVSAYNKGLSVKDTLRQLEAGELLKIDEVNKLAKESLNTLKERELAAKVSIPVSDFIEDNFRKVKLFHIHNHPSNIMLSYFLTKLFEAIGLSSKPVIDGPEMLAHEFPPVLPPVADGLGLSFSNFDAQVGDYNFTTEEWIANCFELYRATPSESGKFAV